MPHEPGTTLKPLVELPANPQQCWRWLGQVSDNGLPRKQHNGKPVSAKRWLWEQLFGKVPSGLEVFGVCGTIYCINPQHLRCGLPHDRVQLGVLANLTPGDVLEIKRAKRAGPYEKQALAMKLGTTLKVLNAIWSGDTWNRVTTLHPLKESQ